MATEKLMIDGEEALTFEKTLEYINARREHPIRPNTLRSYIPSATSKGRAGMPPPDKRLPNGKYSILFYKPSTLDKWLASRRNSNAVNSGATD